MVENLGEFVKDILDFDNISPEVKQQLFEVKQGIAEEYVNKMVKNSPALFVLKDQIKSYLVNEGSIKDMFLDIFREHTLGCLVPEQMNELIYVKNKLSGIKEVPTSEALLTLKADIMESHSITTQTSQSVEQSTNATIGEQSDSQSGDYFDETSSHTTLDESSDVSRPDIITVNQGTDSTIHDGSGNGSSARVGEHSDASQSSVDNTGGERDIHHDNSVDVAETVQKTSSYVEGVSEMQRPFIEQVYKSAASQIGVGYAWGGVSPNTGFDCSGLWNWAFKQQGIKFKGRLSAEGFSFSDVDITKDQVTVGDFMYWDQKPGGKKKHNPIYHIEMVISKPYMKNGKMYVRTLGSSTDSKDDCRNYVGKGVRVREREMKDYRHYGRPPYYYQLAEYQKTGNEQALVVTGAKPSSEVAENVA